MKGQTRIPVSAHIRSSAGIVAGDTIEVDVVRDDEPRTPETRERRIVAVVAELASARRT
jgi:bifunctional DNA-binding transcriptional regulator/antitoxin component of YhaV-PrlF toxin-antitoxin module